MCWTPTVIKKKVKMQNKLISLWPFLLSSYGRLSSYNRCGVWYEDNRGERTKNQAANLGHSRTGALQGSHPLLLPRGRRGTYGLRHYQVKKQSLYHVRLWGGGQQQINTSLSFTLRVYIVSWVCQIAWGEYIQIDEESLLIAFNLERCCTRLQIIRNYSRSDGSIYLMYKMRARLFIVTAANV